MSRYIEWDLENNLEYFLRPHSGDYIDTGILKHVICNVNKPDGVHTNDFLKILTAVLDEIELIPVISIYGGDINEKANVQKICGYDTRGNWEAEKRGNERASRASACVVRKKGGTTF